MKRIVIGTIALLLLMSAVSFATSTRTTTMGQNGMIMVDDDNIHMFPSRVFNYPNLAIGEIEYLESRMEASKTDVDYGTNSFHNFGVTWQFNEDNPFVLGTFVSTLMAKYPVGYEPYDYSPVDFGYSLDPNRRIELIYGRQLGTNNFGAALNYVRSSYTQDDKYVDSDTTITSKPKQAYGEYTLTLGLTEGSTGMWDIAAQFMLGTWTDEDEDGNKITEPDGYYQFTVGGRYFKMMNPKITWVPHAMFGMGKRGFKSYQEEDDTSLTTLDLTGKQTAFFVDLGCGLNYTPAPNILAVMDVGLQYYSLKDEWAYSDYLVENEGYPRPYDDKFKNFALPYFRIGVEGDVFSWMDVRFGATTMWNIEKWESEYTYYPGETFEYSYMYKDTYNWAKNRTYLGFGFHWGNLHVDTYTQPELFLRGFDFISGASSYDGYYSDWMNFKVSVLYEMM